MGLRPTGAHPRSTQRELAGLRVHRVLVVAQERFDAQMLFDPHKDQLDLPAAFVQSADRPGWQSGVVGRTPALPEWRCTMRAKLVHETNSMTWANKVLPTYMRTPRSSQAREATRFLEIEVQIGAKQNQPAASANACSVDPGISFDRTVMTCTKRLASARYGMIVDDRDTLNASLRSAHPHAPRGGQRLPASLPIHSLDAA